MALNCYTYKIEVVLNVLAKDENEALAKIDAGRGDLVSQEKTLLDTINVIVD